VCHGLYSVQRDHVIMHLKDLVFHVRIPWIIETLSKQPSLHYLKASVLKSVAPSLISLMVSVDITEAPCLLTSVELIVQELCESGGGRSGLSVLTSLMVSVDVKL